MLAQGVEANVRWSMRQILESPEGHVKLVAPSTSSKQATYGFSNRVCSTFKIKELNFADVPLADKAKVR
jgi:hypothetical protein